MNEERFVKLRHLYLAAIIGMSIGIVVMAFAGPDPFKVPLSKLPPGVPATATAFVCEYPAAQPKKGPQVIAVIVTFANGLVVRLDGENMLSLGFKNAGELMQYGALAPNGIVYHVPCVDVTNL
jgi:hypothetical protein